MPVLGGKRRTIRHIEEEAKDMADTTPGFGADAGSDDGYPGPAFDPMNRHLVNVTASFESRRSDELQRLERRELHVDAQLRQVQKKMKKAQTFLQEQNTPKFQPTVTIVGQASGEPGNPDTLAIGP